MSPDPDSAATPNYATSASGTANPPLPTSPISSVGAASRKPPPSLWRSTFVSLGNRDHRYLWIGMLFMFGGVQMNMIVRSFLVWEMTESATVVGVVSAAGGVPLFVLALFGGAIADRLERKRLIQAGQASSAAISLFIAVSITTGTVTWLHLLAASMLQGAIFAFLGPARQAILPSIVGKEMLNNALAVTGIGIAATALVAPAAGGLLYVLIGPEGVYYLIVAMTLTATALTTQVPRRAAVAGRGQSAMLSDIAAGLRYISRSRLVMVILAIALGTIVLGMPIRFLMPVFVAEVYQRGSEAFGVLISMIGLGSLLGSLAVASIGRRGRGLLFMATSVASGAALLLLASVPVYYAALGFMMILGVGETGRRVLNQALLMDQVDDAYQGRVMSVFMMSFGLIPLGVLPAGLAIDLLGSQITIGAMGATLLVASALVLVTQGSLRRLQ